MAAGLFVLGLGCYWMSRLNLEISPWQVVWPRVVVIMGLSTIFAPLNVAAFMHIPPQLRGAAVGLLALLRNEGGSVGTSVAQTIYERRDQFHSLRLGEYLDPLNPAVSSYINQSYPGFLQQTGDPGFIASSWPCNPWPICASSNPPPWPTSTASSSSPASPECSSFSFSS